jgi:hypothetical protein
MNPEVKESKYSDATKPSLTVESNESTVTVEAPTVDEASAQVKQVWERIYTFLGGLPEYLGEFFSEYRRPLVTLALILGAIISVKVLLALLDAVNDIPLLAPTFELIGLTYSAWFIYRYLWKASSREELSTDLNRFKEQVFGGRNFPKS